MGRIFLFGARTVQVMMDDIVVVAVLRDRAFPCIILEEEWGEEREETHFHLYRQTVSFAPLSHCL